MKMLSQQEIKTMLQTGSNDNLIIALMAVYDNQTVMEQHSQETVEHNGVGFTGLDAKILSSMAEFWLKRGYLTSKQLAVVRKKMPKYAGQIYRLNEAKLREFEKVDMRKEDEVTVSKQSGPQTYSLELSEIPFDDGDYVHFENGATINFEEFVPQLNSENEVTHWELQVAGGNKYVIFND